jgi:ubiquinone/menaquinone biosynthesis C-methylase UbiE
VSEARPYVPAFGLDALLPFYDAFTRLLGAGRLRRELVAQARLTGAERVLDLGCGTGSLLADLASTHPRLELVGVD